MFESIKAKRNLKYVEKLFANYIDDISPICKGVLLHDLQKVLQNSFEQAKKWGNDFDYELMTIKALYNLAFDEVVSGRHHIFRGLLNEVGNGLVKIVDFCLDEYIKRGIASYSVANEQRQMMYEEISKVG